MSDSDIIDCDNIYCFVEISRGGNLHACISGILYDDVGNGYGSGGYGTVCVVAVLNADRAMTVAPILLMPQILFSGVIFNLEDATEVVSYLTVCRWSMEGYGSTANLNDLKLKMQDQGFEIVHKAEDFLHIICSIY